MMSVIPPRSEAVDAIVAWFESELPCGMDHDEFWGEVSDRVDDLYDEIATELDELKTNGREHEQREVNADSKPRLKIVNVNL